VTVVCFKITGGHVLLNSSDVKKISHLKWHKVKSRNTYYARAHMYKNGKRITVNMQAFLFGCSSVPVDHKDRNGLNNTRRNLRVISHYENLQNYPGKGGKSKFKGVSIFYRGRAHILWRATIAGKTLGLFRDEIAAAKAYDVAARERFGSHCFQNTDEYRL
jgi:hypothetical protein